MKIQWPDRNRNAPYTQVTTYSQSQMSGADKRQACANGLAFHVVELALPLELFRPRWSHLLGNTSPPGRFVLIMYYSNTSVALMI